MPKPPFITRVKLRNYKSIARCDVELGSLAILVGPNGSGKSNFLDALLLTSQALDWRPEEALLVRGGMREVVRRSGERHDRFSISLDFDLPKEDRKGRYSFEVALRKSGGVEISKESCEIGPSGGNGESFYFVVQGGEMVNCNVKAPLPRPFPDRLFLGSIGFFDEFWPLYDALSHLEFYRFDLDILRVPQALSSGEVLHTADGRNLPAALGVMEQRNPAAFHRLQEYMRAIVPGLENISRIEIPIVDLETIQFTLQFGDRENPQPFTAINMSDGTLRALAVLTALLQGGEFPPSIIEIEEPETALHPAAAGVLWDALTDGSERAQVLVSTQSPDLLDRYDVPVEAILAVDMEAGKTEIGPIVESSRRLLQERLATPGELLRQSRLSPKEQVMYPQCFL